MTKKIFEQLAFSLSRIEPESESMESEGHLVWTQCIEAVSYVCKHNNLNFDKDRFETACHREHWKGRKLPL